jgi:hypothetical protein
MKKIKLAICASAATYSRVIPLSDQVSQLGFEVILPATAEAMKSRGAANTEVAVDWSQIADRYGYKAELIRGHFDVITGADAVLVMNLEKDGKPDYIGGNVLMEMTVAFFLHKPIYVYGSAPKDSPLIDEILGMQPIFLNSKLDSLRSLL